MLCSYTLYVTKNLMNFYRVKIKIWDWDLRFNMYMDSCYINVIILVTSGILSSSVLPHKRNFERCSQGSWARGYNSTILELCLTDRPLWAAELCILRSQETYQLSSLLLQYKGLNFGTCRCKSRALDIPCFSCSLPICL